MAASKKLSAMVVTNMLMHAKKHGTGAAARKYKVSVSAVQYWQRKRGERVGVDGAKVGKLVASADHQRVLDAVTLLRKAVKVRPTDSIMSPYDAYVVLALDTLQGGGLR